MNTLIEYLYRDASNYKQYGREVLAGEATDIIGDYDEFLFNAEDAGLPDLSFDGSYEDDPEEHTILKVELTTEQPTLDVTAEEFVKAVCS